MFMLLNVMWLGVFGVPFETLEESAPLEGVEEHLKPSDMSTVMTGGQLTTEPLCD